MSHDTRKTSARLRAIATSRPLIICVALLLLYAVSGFLLAPWLVRHQFPALIDKHFGAQGSVSVVRINPFLLTFEAREIAITEKSGTPALQVGRIFIDFEASSLLRRAWTFREVEIDSPFINADLDAKESLNLARLLKPAQTRAAPAAPRPKRESTQLPRVLLEHFTISGGTFSFIDHTVQPTARARFSPVNFEIRDVSTLPNHLGEHVLTARLPDGGTLKWQGKITLAPIDSSGSIALKDAKLEAPWRFVRDHLTIAQPAGSYELGLHYHLQYNSGALNLQADQLTFRVKDIAIAQQNGGAMMAKLATIALEGGSFDLQKRSLDFKDARIADGTINVGLDEEGKPDWAKLVRGTSAEGRQAGAGTAPSVAKADATPPWQVNLRKVSVGPLALNVEDRSRVNPLHLTIASAQAGFGLAATTGKETQVIVDNGTLKIGDVRVRSGDDKEPVVSVDTVELADGEFDLRQKTARAGLLRVSGGKTQVTREADGSLNLARAFAARGEGSPQDSGFGIVLDRAEVADYSIALADRSYQPAVAYDLENARLAVSKIAFPFKEASPIEAAFRIKQGGAVQAKGDVDLARQTADVRFSASGVALSPLQSVLKRHTTLTLASGKAGASGRVTWSGNKTPAAIHYSGAAAITDLDLKAEGSDERLFSWQRLAASTINFDSAGNRLTIAQVSLAQPYARLIVTKDRSTNLAGIFRPSTAPATTATPAPETGKPMAINVERVGIERGTMDFSDLSLVLPFSTHVKAVGGSVSGLSSKPDSRASLKLEGRVEDYGLARAEGTIQPFTPKKFTDIAVTFRNVALVPLSPYTATFAGRKIASGKLSLDLQYKLHNSELTGDNKVLLEQFTLGERVESPSAINLPLDLAIALLTDSEGKINVAVPVSGNIDKPEFSYGHLVGQAIRTLITRIVTAPFRALGALFGGNAEKLGDIHFDPGSARILPTEYEKLRRVAEGLRKRPQLKLLVQGRYDKEKDGRALRTQAVRADLALREGLKLAKGEEPGPVDFDNAKTQRALENMLNERAGGDAVTKFVAAFRKTAGREVSRVNPALALIGHGAGDRALYEALYQHLIELRELPPSALQNLATARADAITRAFTTRLKFDPARLDKKPAEAIEEAADSGVAVKLSFEPIK